MTQPVGRNSKCPCGSGRKYKQCCLKNNVQYEEDDVGTIRKSIPMSDEMAALFDDHLEDLPDELGHDLTPEDPLFPNQHLEHIEHGIVEAMKSTGIDPALVFAFEETGMLISDENRHLISDEDLAKWESAVSKYREQNKPETMPSFHLVDDSVCWSCEKKLPEGASRCMHCEAAVEDAPTQEDAAMLMELLGEMDPSLMNEMRQMALECETGEDFVNRLMVGECPKCESDNTGNCENDPEIDDPCIGRCFDCSQLFCCDCEELFADAKLSAQHNCPAWEDEEDEPF